MAEEGKTVELKAPLEEIGMYKEWWANPAVLGLMGFALTTMATGLHVAGYYGGGPTLALAIAFGGTAQFIAGVIDFRKGSIFGGTAFCSYGAFWWAVFFLDFVLPKAGVVVDATSKLAFFGMWTMFTFAFCLAAPRIGKMLTILFVLLFIAFVLLDALCLGAVPPGPVGWETFITGLLAWYIAMATLVNTVWGRTVLPLT